MNFKSFFKSPFFKTLAHAAVSAAVVTAAAAVQSGSAITSGNVLAPALTAGALAAVHAALPSTFGFGNDQSK